MSVKQISIFLVNQPGSLAALTKLLQQNEIDLRAMSLAESEDFGIVRIIVDDVYNCNQILKDN
ncbi:MAG: ACT domain-containing protein, partial [bacterium]